MQARLLNKTRQKPEDESTPWFCRKMAAVVGLNKSTVTADLVEHKAETHRLHR